MDINCGLNLQKSSVFEAMSCCTVPAPPPPPPPPQAPLPVDPVDLRDWEDYGMDVDALDSPPHAHDHRISTLRWLTYLRAFLASMLRSWIQH